MPSGEGRLRRETNHEETTFVILEVAFFHMSSFPKSDVCFTTKK